MSYELSIKKENGYLHVQVTGTRTMKTVMSMAAEVLSSCLEHKCRKALVDVQSMSGSLDPIDSYEFSSNYLPDLDPTGTIKVAVVDLGENQNCYELIAHNARKHGFDIHILSDVDKAIELLKEGKWS